MIELELPYPPSLNHFKKVGRIIRTKRGKTYQQRIDTPETKAFYLRVWQTVVAMRSHKAVRFDDRAILEVTLWLHPPDKRKRDVDNPCKVILDSLQKAGVYSDDFQIARLIVERKDIISKGKVIVRIEELKPCI